MRKFIAKVLGLPTKEDVLMMNLKNNVAVESYRKVLQDMNKLREDMKTLYTELDQNISNVKMNVKSIKPILKVQDEEAVKFIKDILKRHDINMNNNQTDLTKRGIELNELKSRADAALENIKRST